MKDHEIKKRRKKLNESYLHFEFTVLIYMLIYMLPFSCSFTCSVTRESPYPFIVSSHVSLEHPIPPFYRIQPLRIIAASRIQRIARTIAALDKAVLRH
jgi:hypothetical protein